MLVSSSPAGSTRTSRELAVMLVVAMAAGLATKAGLQLLSATSFALNAALIVLPFVAGYLGWKRRLSGPAIAVTAAIVDPPASQG